MDVSRVRWGLLQPAQVEAKRVEGHSEVVYPIVECGLPRVPRNFLVQLSWPEELDARIAVEARSSWRHELVILVPQINGLLQGTEQLRRSIQFHQCTPHVVDCGRVAFS